MTASEGQVPEAGSQGPEATVQWLAHMSGQLTTIQKDLTHIHNAIRWLAITIPLGMLALGTVVGMVLGPLLSGLTD